MSRLRVRRPEAAVDGTGRAIGGRPLRAYVSALLVIALLGISAYVAAIMTQARADAEGADRSRRAVHAVVAVEVAQDALGAELMPSLLTHLLGSAPTIPWLGVDSTRNARSLGRVMGLSLTSGREAADDVLATALQSAPDPRLSTVVDDLARLRGRVDLTGPGASDLAGIVSGYLAVADRLDLVEQDAVTTALAESRDRLRVSALQDMTAVAAANRSASRQLATLVLHRLAPQLAADMEAALPTWSQAALRLDTLASADLRAQWWSIRETNPLGGRDSDGVFRSSTPGVELDLNRGLALSTSRSTALLTLLYSALTRADQNARDAGTAAARRLNEALATAAALAIASTVAAVRVGLSIERPLRRLAEEARQIRDGRLVDIEASGPREVRTVSVALGSAVEGLRRVQAQAACVARGDLGDPLLSQPLAGPLGRVVHASIEMIVAAVRESEELQAQLAHRAAHDELTGLLNRAGAMDRITGLLAASEEGRTALLFLDLDAFKAVNDSFGHAAGDSLLRTLASRFTDVVGPDGMVARLGGDEFLVLVRARDGEPDAVALAERLVRSAAEPVVVPTDAGPQRAVVGASVGVAVARGGLRTGEALMGAADAAVYEAKARGRGCVRVFDGELQARQAERAALEDELTGAVRAGALQVAYQRIVGLPSGGTVGWEALVRWERPGHGVLTAGDFVPIAETSRLALEIDRWVLREGLAQLARWTREGAPPESTLTVNLSSRHLVDPGVVETVRAALRETSVPGHRLVVDIHGRVLGDAAARRHLRELRDLGVRVAVEDFGRLHRWLGGLDRLPVDLVKLEPDLVVPADPTGPALLRAMVDAAHALGLPVVAEGLDSVDGLDALHEQSFDAAQGFLVSRGAPGGDGAGPAGAGGLPVAAGRP